MLPGPRAPLPSLSFSPAEKGVENLRADLGQLDGEVVAHLKQAVAEHYGEFTRATPGGWVGRRKRVEWAFTPAVVCLAVLLLES
jgi:hypothetical protein